MQDPAVWLLGLLMTTAVATVAVVATHPSLTASRNGKILAFVGFFLLPAGSLWAGLMLHMESSKSTEFCLSCHVMEPYGESLWLDDPAALPASHFQNRRVDRDQACFSCHTQYTMFGDYRAKLVGLKHLYVQYFGEIPEQLSLYSPYQNRECLHCHDGARNFTGEHLDYAAELSSGEMSCLECHDVGHNVAELEGAARWTAEASREGDAGE